MFFEMYTKLSLALGILPFNVLWYICPKYTIAHTYMVYLGLFDMHLPSSAQLGKTRTAQAQLCGMTANIFLNLMGNSYLLI